MIGNKKVLPSIIYIYFLIASLLHPKHSIAFDFENEIDRIFATPDNNIDMGIAALTVAKDIYPDLDIQAYSEKIDLIVNGARLITEGNKDPDYRVRALNTYLYKYVGIQYDSTDPYTKKDENRYLNGIIDTRKGSCVTMPLLYLVVAQRLGYPVYAVSVPWHFFVRYDDPNLIQQNIEATGGGGYVPDDEYKEVLQISERSIRSGAYLRTKTNREYIADLVAHNAIYWGQKGDIQKAIRYLEKCIKVHPQSADIFKTLGGAYLVYSRQVKGNKAKKLRLFAEIYLARADDLGVTKTSNRNYMEEQIKAQEEYRKKRKGG
jgi:regulator of sirC expression with transglutaminase-like and TPR domain